FLFAGQIPESIGLLVLLKFLYLDGNALEGAIPAEISDLKHLEELMLSDNLLEGAIPWKMGGLVHLALATFSGNNALEGNPGDLTSPYDVQNWQATLPLHPPSPPGKQQPTTDMIYQAVIGAQRDICGVESLTRQLKVSVSSIAAEVDGIKAQICKISNILDALIIGQLECPKLFLLAPMSEEL
ncbi:unnamed protein product, partial [Phaeothamnion confervicola]